MIHKSLLAVRRTCPSCHGARPLPAVGGPECPRCHGGGTVEAVVDATGAARLGGAAVLPQLLARGLEVCEGLTREVRRLEAAGDAEGALLARARRSGFAECLSGLDLFLARLGRRTRPAPRRAAV